MNEIDFAKTIKRIDARLDHIESMVEQIVDDRETIKALDKRMGRVELKTSVLEALRN